MFLILNPSYVCWKNDGKKKGGGERKGVSRCVMSHSLERESESIEQSRDLHSLYIEREERGMVHEKF